jgi:hypothetical protein
MGQEGLEKLTVSQLRARASELEISGRSSMSKDDLIEAIASAEHSEWSPPSDDDGSASNGEDRAGDGEKPASEITAPSIGPNTVIEKAPPEERLDKDKISDVDAMGLDKRRSVVGHSYSASLGKQVVLYGIFLAVLAALVFGGKMLVDEADAPPAEYKDDAPWVGNQSPPDPLQ